MDRTVSPVPISPPRVEQTVVAVLVALSVSHMLNDIIQALVPALYPLLKQSFHLNFTQIGLITLTFQCTASLLQPVIGTLTDRHPQPFSLPIGMGITLVGLILLSRAWSFPVVLVAAALIGMGSAVFHPEASRMARMASGGRHGLAQSLFQVGGNFGSSLGPLLATLIAFQANILWFTALALVGILLLSRLSLWYRDHLLKRVASGKKTVGPGLSRGQVTRALLVLLALIFSKYIYLTSLTSYYTFYLIGKFGVTVPQAQKLLFVFLFAVAAGTIIGGPLGDRFGRKYVIWISILGAAPFTLALPYVGLVPAAILTGIIGLILASAFSAIIVYAQELMPGKVGMIAGLFFGFAFGVAGVSSALLGKLADKTSIETVFHVCSYMPLIGLLTIFLPNLETDVAKRARGV